ncbi:MAG: carboxylesterase family protein, partial [Planctomycetota bacterium]
MRILSVAALLMASLLVTEFVGSVSAQQKLANLPYREQPHERHVLDVYLPEQKSSAARPVIFWIHGGGWQAGDKSDVGLKPAVAAARDTLFVSTNYRLLPHVSMEELID